MNRKLTRKKMIALVMAITMMIPITACNKDTPTEEAEYHAVKTGDISIETCENTIENFFNAAKAGDIENILRYSDGSYYVQNWTSNQETLSEILKYMCENITWEFNLDSMKDDNALSVQELKNGNSVSFKVAWTGDQWNMAKSVFIQNIAFDRDRPHTEDDGGYVQCIPSKITKENGYDLFNTMDLISPHIPKTAHDALTLVVKDNSIKVQANSFFSYLFRSNNIFSHSENPDEYLRCMLFGEDWNSEYPLFQTMQHKTKIERNDTEEQLTNQIFERLKLKQDYEIYNDLINSGNGTLAESLKGNYFVKNIAEQLNDGKRTDIEGQYNNMLQITEEYECDASGVRTAVLYRFYNTPTNSLANSPQLQLFVNKAGAYWNTYSFDSGEFSFETPGLALSVLSDYITHQG